MAELAAGAVSSLLVVIRNEAVLLRGVRDDVQFIKEEMESMNSFLVHLARTEPPGGEHDEQVRTWMSQVRQLAQDCNNCINIYLYRGNPDIHRARVGLRRYLWRARWLLHKLVAQHNAAMELCQLKERACDVGERRLRYGVQVPAKLAGRRSARAASDGGGGYAAADDEEDRDYYQLKTATGQHRRRAFFEPPTLEDYAKTKLLQWEYDEIPTCAKESMSLAIVAPNAGQDVLTLAHQALVVLPPHDHTSPVPALHLNFMRQREKPTHGFCGYHRGIIVDIPAVHLNFLLLRPKDVLYYILRELQHTKSRFQMHDKDQVQDEEEEEVDKKEKEEEEEEEEDKKEEEEGDKKEEDEDEEEDEEEALQQKSEDEEEEDSLQDYIDKFRIHLQKKRALIKIERCINTKEIDGKFDKMKSDIQTQQNKGNQKQLLGDHDINVQNKDVDQLGVAVLFQLLHKLPGDNESIKKVTKKLKEYVEADEEVKEIVAVDEAIERRGDREEDEEEEEWIEGDEDAKEYFQFLSGLIEDYSDGNEEEGDEKIEEYSIHLDELQYEQIIRQVFEKTIKKPLQAQQQDRIEAKKATKTRATALSEDQVKEIIHKAKQDILKELQEGKLDKNKALSEPIDTATDIPSQNKKDDSELERKFEEMKKKFKEQLKIKGLVDKIKNHLGRDCPLIILKVDRMMDESIWEDTRKALSLLKLSADALIFTTIKDIQRAKGYCHPSREPIIYSLVGLYHHTVLELTNEQKNEDNYNPKLFRDILEQCESHEFCMKIFTHALHANPKRSTEELKKLHKDLQASPKSFDVIAKKMFKFSYNELRKEYKSCLLYLAIFPQGQSIRRSTLVGRWVAEGLIFKEDWHTSVLEANRCFDALINRWLVYPADVGGLGATGKVKNCVVGDLVHGFITTIARKQHIVEARLAHRFARHFSIFNDFRLRSSDKMDTFFKMLSESSQLSLLKLKVLDLEGCWCFVPRKRNEHYLNEICTKMLLLKYLSLRRTGISLLPNEINNLLELEVLDIRETRVPAYATVSVLLLKLKRLLAGPSDLIPGNSAINSSVHIIPHKIGKMVNMEVLSNVKAEKNRDLKEIGHLCQLRKLGVVVDDKDNRVQQLLDTIKDLHECLWSLSITLSMDRREGTRPQLKLEQPPKHLESLSISGSISGSISRSISGEHLLLPLFTKESSNTLAKVTLSNTLLNHNDMEILAKMPKLRCLRLRHIAFTEGVLTLKKDGFKCLKYLLVEPSILTSIDFKDEAAQELEMIVLSSTWIESVSGVDMLPKLEEIELNNNHSSSHLLSSLEDAKQIAKLTLRGTLLEQDLRMLAKKPNIQCLVLLDTSCDATQNKIAFHKDEFPKLNFLIIHSSAITNIVFAKGSARKLQKIIWSSSTRLFGIHNLPKLKELESHGGPIVDEVKKDIHEHPNKPKHNHIEEENPDQAIGPDDDDNDGSTRFPLCWKKWD